MGDRTVSRSPELLSAATSRLVVIDVQERLLPIIPNGDDMVANCIKLLKGAALLEVPCCGVEQYPKGLGPTVEPLAALISDRTTKLRFSAAEAFSWLQDPAQKDGRHQIVVAGIETHVCVMQTAFDLLAAGYDVFVVVDAIGSRAAINHDVGLQRLSDAGARLVTTEMVLFEWCEVAGTDTFKQLSKIVTGRDQAPKPGIGFHS